MNVLDRIEMVGDGYLTSGKLMQDARRNFASANDAPASLAKTFGNVRRLCLIHRMSSKVAKIHLLLVPLLQRWNESKTWELLSD